jgi:molybdopterin molybdotransferase
MDGFAVCSEQLRNCSLENPVSLPIGATIFAGDVLNNSYEKNSVAKIMTGAQVPPEYDSVVKIEDSENDNRQATFSKSVTSGLNIRNPGEDIVIGETLYLKGDCLKPFDLGVLASIGVIEVPIFMKPSVLIAVTGDELVEPGKILNPGQIYNSNKYTLLSMISGFCEKVESYSPAHDTEKVLDSILKNEHDVIITSGGVSAGERDLVVSTAERNGWETVFHKVAMKPGKPVYFARRKKQLLFGLPGNPLSVAITCAVFVIPTLKKMSGNKRFQLRFTPGELINSSYKNFNGTYIWPGKIEKSHLGLMASFSSKSSSASLTALLESDGLIFQSKSNRGENSSPKIEVITWPQLFGQWSDT